MSAAITVLTHGLYKQAVRELMQQSLARWRKRDPPRQAPTGAAKEPREHEGKTHGFVATE